MADKNWTYETGCFESDILGSGGTYSHVLKTKNENFAIQSAVCPRNYLIRYYYDEKQRRIEQIYDSHTKSWI